MKKTFRIVLLISCLISLLVIAVYWCFKERTKSQAITDKYVVDFKKHNLRVYINANTWGLAGNHEQITVSLSPFENNEDYFKNKCLIFYAPQIFYKKQGVDTLLIYAASSAIPKKTKTLTNSIKIVQRELDNYDVLRDYDLNYKKYGLSKASIYDK